MPQIPLSRRQVQRQAISGQGFATERPLVEDRTAELRAVSQAFGQIENVINKQIAEAEDIEISAFKTRLRQKQNDLLHNKDTGFYKVAGKDTTTQQDNYNKDFSLYVDEQIKGLGNDRLRQRAQVIADGYKVDVDRQLNTHTMREMDKYDTAQFKTNLDSLRENAALNYKDYTASVPKIQKSLAEQRAEIERYGARKGMSRKMIDSMINDQSSALHYEVITGALNNGEDLLARDYYAAAKERNEIDGDTSQKLDKLVQASSVKGESIRQTNLIFGESRSLGEMLEEARAIKDPDVMTATVQRVKNRYNEHKLITKEKVFQDAQNIKEQLDQYSTMDHIPPSQLGQLKKEKRLLIERYAALMAKGERPNTDPLVKNKLMTMASTPELRSQFMQTDLTDYITKLSPSDYNSFLSMRKSIQEGSSKHDVEYGKFLSDTAVIKNVMAASGISGDRKEAEFTNIVMQAAVEWQRVNQKKDIPNDELYKLASRYALDVEVKGRLYDPDKKVYQIQPGEKLLIPQDFLEGMRLAYKKRGLVYPEKNLEKVKADYLDYLSKKGK